MGVSISSKKRLLIALLCIALIFTLLAGRLFYLQLIAGDELQQKALSQWTRETPLSAARGRIVDTNGTVLAMSGVAYKVLLWPDSIDAGDTKRVSAELARILNMDEASVLEKASDKKKQEIVLARQLDREVVDEILSLKLGGGVGIAVDTKRFYPSGTLLSQVIGFTTIDGVGQEGLELKLNKYLAGEDGRMITETDRKGRTIAYGAQEYIEPTDGYDVLLTTDSVIQSFLEKALKEAQNINKAKRAVGIVMDVQTGAIVALSTQPDYDPNDPPRKDLELLQELSKNRVVCDVYEPGSTFKIVTLSAALDSNSASTSDTVDCPGFYMVGQQKIKCWKSGGHGHQTLTEAVENSCNPAFMRMALSMGVEEFYDYIYAFGFGSVTNSSLTGESSGLVIHEKYVRDLNLARIGFGQSIAITPIQLITAVSAAVNGGRLMQPYIVDKIVSASGDVISETEPTVVRRVISEDTSKTVREMLESVVANGSGRNAQIPGYRVGGKTGTAQKYEDGQVAQGKLIASFIGFAPADDPRFACLILVDEPQVGSIFGSTVAAPFVKNVLEETLRHYDYLPNGGAETVTVPDLTGMTTAEAAKTLKDMGLEAVYQAEDEVTMQLPGAGEKVLAGSQVLLYTDLTGFMMEEGDLDTVEVPDLSGCTRLEASDKLAELGLVLKIDEEYQNGAAFDQDYKPGAEVAVGTVVTVRFKQDG